MIRNVVVALSFLFLPHVFSQERKMSTEKAPSGEPSTETQQQGTAGTMGELATQNQTGGTAGQTGSGTGTAGQTLPTATAQSSMTATSSTGGAAQTS